MTQNPPWLVAVDIDGTLLNTEVDNRLARREIEALEAVRNAGHCLALCTGRNLNSARNLLEKSGWFPDDLPLILLNGAVVWGDVPRRKLVCNTLTGDQVAALIHLFKAHDTVPMVYGTDEDGGILYHERRPVNDILGRYLGNRRLEVGAIEAVEDLEMLTWQGALEVGTIDTRERVMSLSDGVREVLGQGVKVINTRSLLGGGIFYWAEAFHRASDKGSAMRFAAAHFGIPLRRTLAMGDNYNDLDMFEAAAFSVAMADGPQDVRDQADMVTGGVAAGGAADVLQALAAGTLRLPDGD